MRQLEHAQIFALVGKAELAAQPLQLDVADHQVGLARRAIGDDRPLHVGNNGLHVRLIQAENRRAIKRHAIHELQKRALNVFQRGVLVEMFAINGGHDRHDRRKHQEAAVALIGFHNKIFALADARGGARLIDSSADHKRGIEMRGGKNRSHHRSGGGFSVRSGNRNAVFQAHQFRQHFRARDHRDFPLVRFHYFRIVGFHRRGNDHYVRAFDVFGLWPS